MVFGISAIPKKGIYEIVTNLRAHSSPEESV
jgi:hypothetical protein